MIQIVMMAAKVGLQDAECKTSVYSKKGKEKKKKKKKHDHYFWSGISIPSIQAIHQYFLVLVQNRPFLVSSSPS